ncbi:MAG TPA: two-component sensor histidine kinase [Maritimibacter sp.]|nr:two-component sensor histidine kinase [Maritimibacter sp.]
MQSSQMLDAVPMAAMSLDAEGRISGMNSHAEALFGATVRGRSHVAVLRQPSVLEAIETAGQTGQSVRGQFVTKRQGRDRVYDVLITPFPDASETILTFEDVTATEQAGEMRSEFVANVSHELRTPLTAISGFIETLRGPAREDAEAREAFLEIMEREARRMHRLVDDLLSLAKVEDMEGLRPTERYDIADVVNGCVRNLTQMAQDRNVTIIVNGADAPAFAPADADQLTQVFNNLIENAIKYGGSGGEVTVDLTRVERDPILGVPAFVVSVSDNGDGIDERHLGRLTERFYRVDTHRSRGMGGTGLGLAIVKHILKRHRGRLRIHSKPGQGSRFEVSLPCQ